MQSASLFRVAATSAQQLLRQSCCLWLDWTWVFDA